MSNIIQLRKDTLENWLKYDPVLADGEEVLVATDSTQPNIYNSRKVGDGISKFSALPMLGFDCLQDMGNNTLMPMSQAAVTKAMPTVFDQSLEKRTAKGLDDTGEKLVNVEVLKGTINSKITEEENTVPSSKAVYNMGFNLDSLNGLTEFTNFIENSEINSNGEIVTSEGYCVSDYINFPTYGSKIFVIGIEPTGVINYYDENKDLWFSQNITMPNNDYWFKETNLSIDTIIPGYIYQINHRGNVARSRYIRFSFKKLNDTTPYYTTSLSATLWFVSKFSRNSLSSLSKIIKLKEDVIIKEIKFDEATKGKYLGYDNNLTSDAQYIVSEYIKFPEGSDEIYVKTKCPIGGYVCFYNKTFEFFFSDTTTSEETVKKINEDTYWIRKRGGEGCGYCRISFKVAEYPNYTIENAWDTYSIYSNKPFDDSYSLIEGAIEISNLNTSAVSSFLNESVHAAFNRNDNKYYTEKGELKENQYWSSLEYDLTAIEELTTLYAPYGGGVSEDLCPFVFLDEDKRVLFSINSFKKLHNVKTKGAKYLYVSFRNRMYPIVTVIKDGNISRQIDFKGNLNSLSNSVTFGSLNYIKKNTVLCIFGNIKEGFSKIIIERGKGMYFSDKIEITKDSIIKKEKSIPLKTQLKEGDNIRIEVISDKFNICKVVITHIFLVEGSEFQEEYNLNQTFYADGFSYLSSDGFEVYSAQQITLDCQCKARVYGDSFGNTYSTARWPRVSASMGGNFMVNALTGNGSADAFKSVMRDIEMFGHSKIIVWALGMNDGNDANEETPNSSWLDYLNSLSEICKELRITFIPCTIPSTPIRYNEGKNQYIRNNFIRYIDFAKAVDNGVDNSWISGALSSDKVHPSELGANLLAMQALKDCPELFNSPY